MSSSPSRRRAFPPLLLALAGGILAPGARAAGSGASGGGPTSERPLRIVLHVSDADGWGAALSNLKNLTALRPSPQLRVVVDGSGVYMLQGSTDLTPQFAKYAGLGVEFMACHNALAEKHISPAALPGFVRVVPAAVVALAESQYAGFAYVKP